MNHFNPDIPLSTNLDCAPVFTSIGNYTKTLEQITRPTTQEDIEYFLTPKIEQWNQALVSHIGKRVVAMASDSHIYQPYIYDEAGTLDPHTIMTYPHNKNVSLDGTFLGVSLDLAPVYKDDLTLLTNDDGVALYKPSVLYDVQTDTYTDEATYETYPIIGHSVANDTQLFFTHDRAIELGVEADSFLKTTDKETLTVPLRRALSGLLYSSNRERAADHLRTVAHYLDEQATENEQFPYDNVTNVLRAAFPADTPLAIDASYHLRNDAETSSEFMADDSALHDIRVEDIVPASYTKQTSPKRLELDSNRAKHYIFTRTPSGSMLIPLDAITSIVPEYSHERA